jgi:molybdenum cofactor cytidylyltransferase
VKGDVAAVVLAAGLSRRMKCRPKLLLPLEGRPVVRHAVERVLAAGIDTVVVVAGHEAPALADALHGLPVQICENPAPETGQAGSVAIGIAALPAAARAALIALGDQPFVDDRIIPALLAARAQTAKPIVAPRYRDGRGNPVLFGREVFPELVAIAGDEGARSVVARDGGRVALVPFDFDMPPDVDTPEDYERLRHDHPSR